MSILKKEINYYEIVLRSYILYAIIFSTAFVCIIYIQAIAYVSSNITSNDKIAIVELGLFLGSVIIAPIFTLASFFSFTERSFSYGRERPSYIKAQLGRKHFILVHQNENHFVYKLNKGRNFLNLKIVLVFNQDYFIVYGTKKIIKKLVDECVWNDYNFASYSDTFSSPAQN